jgi:hypothetical protein
MAKQDHRQVAGIPPGPLAGLLTLQARVVTHAQAIKGGKSRHEIATLVGNGRWQRLHRGVYYALAGPVPREALLWGAVLRVGHGGVLSHESAAEVWKFADRPSDVIHVSVPRTAGTLPATEGLRLHYSSRLPQAAFQAAAEFRAPPVTRAEETVLDLAGTSATAEDAVAWAVKACQRKTTPDLIGGFMLAPGHRTLRWRDDLRDALAEIRAGVESPLERRYLRHVEQAHKLPEGGRQDTKRRGKPAQFHDVRYIDFGVGVELDGMAYHRADAVDRDIARDNSSTLTGILTLRYGWLRVAYHPCEVAHEVWTLLARRGYDRDFQRCGPGCGAPAKPASVAEARALP